MKKLSSIIICCLLVGCGEDKDEVSNCDLLAKPFDSCICEGGQWKCSGEAAECPTECANSCDDHGVCKNGSAVECPDECPGNCDERGMCKGNDRVECPAECKDTCDMNGICPEPACPSTCLDGCTNGVCNEGTVVECPKACADSCDSDGLCPVVCPEECPEQCDDLGACPVKCPSECPMTCDAAGLCPVVCPDACPNDCDDKGACICPASCTNGCDESGKCQCPSACKGTCNEKGECPVMCGDEIVSSMYFAFPENDLLVPGAKARVSANIPLYVKTNNGTYKNGVNISTSKNLPCKLSVVSSNTKVMTVKLNDGVPAFAAVGAGKATATAKLDGQTMEAKIQINVLNPNNLKDDLTKHVYLGPVKLIHSKQPAQGLDFSSSYALNKETDLVYFSQLSDSNNSVIVFPGKLNKYVNQKPMKLFHAGHGQGLSIEHTDTGDVVWIGNYGSLGSKGFDDAQTIVSVPYVADKAYYPEDLEHYYYPKNSVGAFIKLEPALDTKNNRFLLRAKNDGDNKTYIKIYDLKKIKALKVTENAVLPKSIMTFSKSGEDLPDQKPTIRAKDLSQLTPIHSFEASGFPTQGVAINNGIIYAVTNSSNFKMDNFDTDMCPRYHFDIEVRMYSMAGTLIGTYYLQTATPSSDHYLNNNDLDDLLNIVDENGNTYRNIGYFEPEGIRARDGKVYISVAAKLEQIPEKKITEFQYILEFDLTSK